MKKVSSKSIMLFLAIAAATAWGIDQMGLSNPIVLSNQVPALNDAYKSKIVRTSQGILVVVYGDILEDNPDHYVFDSKANSERAARDVFITVCDSGNSDCSVSGSWSAPVNISKTALLSSIQTDWSGDGIRTPYHGDSDNPHIFAAGNHVVVTWGDNYCPGGQQRTVTYLEFGSREIAMSCMYAAHASSNYGDLSGWTVDRLSDGSRDVKQDTSKGLSSGVWAITWQEDPLGLQPGEAEGPGEGSSGAKTSNGTDIWYTYTSNVSSAVSDIGAWAVPVRLTDNHTGFGVSGSFNPIKDADGNQVNPAQVDKGKTAASRANLMVVGGSNPPNTVVAYEESKGSAGLAEGKFLRYHVFPYNSPPATPEDKAGCIISDPAENARRARFVTQTNAATGSGIRMALFWRQGLYSQGGPADIMMRIGYKTADAGSTGLNPQDLDPPVDAACQALDYASAVSLTSAPPLNLSSNTPAAQDANLADSTDADFLENARAHRAVLRANDLYVGYTYAEDGVVADATDLANYNFYVRHFDAMSGVWGKPFNLSNITDTGINVLEPRLIGTPGNGPGCTDPANIVNPENCQNKNVLIAAWGTETNVYQHIGGSQNLDIFITRSTDKAAHWGPVNYLAAGPNSQGESQIRVTPDGSRIFAVWNETANGSTDGMYSEGTPISLYSDVAVSTASIPAEVYAGEEIHLSYAVENLGPDKAYDISLDINLPGSVQYLSASDMCTHSTGKVTCALGDIETNTSVTVDLAVKTGIVEPLAFIATARSSALNDTDMSNNQARSVVNAVAGIASADIVVSANANPGSLRASRHTQVSIEILNRGSSPATNVILAINSPAVWEQRSLTVSRGSCRVAGNSLTCDVGSLMAGGSSVVTLTGTADLEGAVVFQATGAAAEFDPDESNNQSSVEVDFTVKKTEGTNYFGCSISGNPDARMPFDPVLPALALMALYMAGIRERKKKTCKLKGDQEAR